MILSNVFFDKKTSMQFIVDEKTAYSYVSIVYSIPISVSCLTTRIYSTYF